MIHIGILVSPPLWENTLTILYISLKQLEVLVIVNKPKNAAQKCPCTTCVNVCQVYDPESNQWRLCGAMNYRRLGGGVGVMRAPHHDNHYIW